MIVFEEVWDFMFFALPHVETSLPYYQLERTLATIARNPKRITALSSFGFS